MDWLNPFGLAIVLLILAPNILWAMRVRFQSVTLAGKAIQVLEQIGRFGSMLLMCVSLGIFEFNTVWDVLVPYLLVNSCLLLLYWLFWAFFWHRRTAGKARMLAILPSAIFLFSGLLTLHWLLVVCGAIFAFAHLTITYRTQWTER